MAPDTATRTLAATVAVLAVVLVAACGRDNNAAENPTSTATGGPDDRLVLQVERLGGFAPAAAAFSRVAVLTVYSDGRAITHGPQIAIYPPPALPNLQVQRLSAGQVAALLELAEEAGLLTDPPDYGTPPIADAATTVVTLHAGGATYVHEAYALGVDLLRPGGGQKLPGAGQAREALAGFVDAAQNLVADGGTAAPYEPDAFAIRASPAPAGSESGVKPWPLPEIDLRSAARCRVVMGAAAESLGDALATANQRSRFEQDGALYNIAVRPLLPHERGCAPLA